MTAEIGPTKDIAACQAIRHAVFIEEQGVAPDMERDGKDGEAHHILARLDGTPVGAARILITGETGKIGRVCVLRAHRRTGLGRALVEASVAHLRSQSGVSRAVLGSQAHAVPFYESLGFTPFGAAYEEVGIPHRNMERRL